MPNVHIDNVGDLAVVECEGRFVRSDAAFKLRDAVTSQATARTLVLDPASHRIYLAAAQFGPRPAAEPDQPASHPNVVPDTFIILVAQPK